MATSSTAQAAKNETSAKTGDTEGSEASGTDMTRVLMAENMIKSYVVGSTAAAIVPIPLFDIAAVIGIQLRMIQKMSELYHRPFSENLARKLVTSLAGGVLGYGAGATIGMSLMKAVPGVGWALGMVSIPVVAGASTYAVGRVFLKHFEDGGSVFDFSVEGAKAFYKEQFEKGKDVAKDAKDKVAEAA